MDPVLVLGLHKAMAVTLSRPRFPYLRARHSHSCPGRFWWQSPARMVTANCGWLFNPDSTLPRDRHRGPLSTCGTGVALTSPREVTVRFSSSSFFL